MGIYHEDKILQPKKDGNVLEKMLYDGYKEVDEIFKNIGDTILIQRDVEEKWDTTRSSQKPVPPISIPVEISVYTEEMGAVNVRYSKYSPTKTGKVVSYPNNRILAGKNMVLHRGEKDLAWYLLIATKFVERGEINADAGVFKINNPVAELKEKARGVQRIASLDKYLSDVESPIYNMEAIQEIAGILGIDIPGDDIDLATYQIRESVISGDKAKNPGLNIDRFKEVADNIIKKAKKEEKAKEDESNEITMPMGGYTEEYLQGLHQKQLNKLSRSIGTLYPPRCNKQTQIELILKETLQTQE